MIGKPSELQTGRINSPRRMVSRDESNGTLRSDKFSKLQNGPFRCTTAERNSGQNSGKLLRRYPRHQILHNYSLISAQINPNFPDPYIHSIKEFQKKKERRDRKHSARMISGIIEMVGKTANL